MSDNETPSDLWPLPEKVAIGRAMLDAYKAATKTAEDSQEAVAEAVSCLHALSLTDEAAFGDFMRTRVDARKYMKRDFRKVQRRLEKMGVNTEEVADALEKH
jgi:hypothetical protein